MATKPSTAGPRRTGLTDDDVDRYFRALAGAVDRAVPIGPHGGVRTFLTRERLRTAVWIHQVYRHPLSSAVFARPTGPVVLAARRSHSAALARRLEGVGWPAFVPHTTGCAIAATAVLWGVTEDAVTSCPRPPCEQVVTDVWGVMRASLSPGPRATGPLPFVRARGAW